MPRREVEFHEEAALEFEAAVDWYLEHSETVAIRFLSEVGDAIDLIAHSPRRWASGPWGTRTFLLRRFPFAVVYRELSDRIQILAVAHGRRRPGYWKQRV
jgi:plasmid stabilization system protein ParE